MSMEEHFSPIKEESSTQIIAKSNQNITVELIDELGNRDLISILEISDSLSSFFGNKPILNENNYLKYFNKDTFPFTLRYKDSIISFIIGAPTEFFQDESWVHYDTNIGKNNTLYTYAFLMKKKFHGKGGYSKTLKQIYINWARKQGYKYVTGHVKQGVAKKFKGNTEIIKIFNSWYGQEQPFEYYRRSI